MELKEKQYYIVVCKDAGIFFAQIEERRGDEADLLDVRRIYYWEGACSVNQLAVDGTAKPQKCKFSVPVESMTVLDVIAILPCTAKATKSIEGVPMWKI